MAKFECNWCGKCCSSFGEFIKIERQLTSRDYYCKYGITNEVFMVHVNPEFADDIDEEFMVSDPKEPLARKPVSSPENPTERVCLRIYETRPSICREVRCYRMLIHHPPTGELRGKSSGSMSSVPMMRSSKISGKRRSPACLIRSMQDCPGHRFTGTMRMSVPTSLMSSTVMTKTG